jgi:hypothetical protein
MKIMEPKSPPNKPEYVFLGDIFGKIFGPPNSFPTIKAIESFTITPANKRNVNGEPMTSILLKNIKDAKLPKIYITPKTIQKALFEKLLIIFKYSLKARTKQTETKRLNKRIWLIMI